MSMNQSLLTPKTATMASLTGYCQTWMLHLIEEKVNLLPKILNVLTVGKHLTLKRICSPILSKCMDSH